MSYKILAIDDHPETLSIVTATLKGHGYRVVSSLSPIKALELAEKELPDLVLVDLNMPEMDGNEVCRHLRANDRMRDVPIIMFTAMGDVEYKLAGFDSGVDDYLTKPTEPAELIERVKNLLENRGLPPRTATSALGLTGMVNLPNAPKIEPPRGGERLIVVLGARGGVGTTLVAINLAVAIAEMSQPTILADMDMVQGHIGFYLNQKPSGSINTLVSMTADGIRHNATAQLSTYMPNLQLLLARPNLSGRYPIITANQTNILFETLLRPGCCVVVDLGRGYTESLRPVFDRADAILVCFSPERVALSATQQFLKQVQEILFPGTELGPIMVDVHGGGGLPQNAVQGFLGMPLLGEVVTSRKEIALAVNKGISLVQAHPQSPTTAVFRQLARQVLKV